MFRSPRCNPQSPVLVVPVVSSFCVPIDAAPRGYNHRRNIPHYWRLTILPMSSRAFLNLRIGLRRRQSGPRRCTTETRGRSMSWAGENDETAAIVMRRCQAIKRDTYVTRCVLQGNLSSTEQDCVPVVQTPCNTAHREMCDHFVIVSSSSMVRFCNTRGKCGKQCGIELRRCGMGEAS
jgi:hypothetical protein